MDIVFIRELTIEAVIGIYEWERCVKQTLYLDLELGCDVRPAADSEDIGCALDYKAISKRVHAFVVESEFQLVETLAEKVAQLLMTEFGVPWLRLTVNKRGALSLAKDVGVIIERGSQS